MSRLRIAFVGQCHTVGYPGVPPDTAFPEVCRGALQARRPDHRVELLLAPYYHPAELSRTVRTILLQRPRVVVIEVVGWLAVTGSVVVDLSRMPRRIRTSYQRARHLREAARLLEQKAPRSAGLVFQVRKNAMAMASSLLQPLLPRYPRPSVGEYEDSVADAIALIRSEPGTSAVVQGPGAPNLALDSKRMAPDAMERYRAVNEMARRVAAAHGALYVDRWDTVTGSFFIPGTTRPTRNGHSVWGHLLAEQLLSAGLL